MISTQKAPFALMIVNTLQNLMFWLPILMLYYGYKGVSMGDFFLIQGLASLFVFVMEIPTGYIGDVFSRKKVVLLGLAGWLCGYICWLSGEGFFAVLAGELLFSLGISLSSGTLEAYLYDLLKKTHRENLFHEKLSRFEMVSNGGLFFSTLVGAPLYYYVHPEAPIWGCVIALILGITLLCFLPDVPEARRQVDKQTSKIKDILNIVKFTARQPQIRWLILYPSIYGLLTFILMWSLQSVMMERSIPVVLFSFIYAANSLVRMGWSGISGRLLEKMGLNKVIYLTLVVIGVSMAAASLSVYVSIVWVYVCLALMIIGNSSICLANITTSILIHHQIDSDERSTVISVKSMASRALSSIGLISLKPLIDSCGLGQTFLFACVLLVPTILSAVFLLKMRLKLEKKAS